MRLNHAQQQAVACIDSPCLVLAGAGSGKTRVIIQKIEFLLQSGMAAQHIAAITFTNKAAHEMRERLKTTVDKSALKKLHILTFHALGLQILRQDAQALGYKPAFSIFDSDDCQGLMMELLQTQDRPKAQTILSYISRWKNAGVHPRTQVLDNEFSQQAALMYDEYLRMMRAYQAVDFDDLILLPHLLFEQHPDILARWQTKLQYILVDEYQDTNMLQYALLKQLVAGKARTAFTLVGDHDQSIYAWRGADVENIQRLQADFATLVVIKLEQNYRSTSKVLHAANQLIQHNPQIFEKKLWSDLGEGEDIAIYKMDDEAHEAQGTVFRIQMHQREYKTHWGNYAILYRSNYQARLMEQALRRDGIPYIISGGQSMFDKPEIKDVYAYLRLIVNPDDDPAFIRAISTPKKGIGPQTLAKMGEFAAKMHTSLFYACSMHMLADEIGETAYHSLQNFVSFIDHAHHHIEKTDVHTFIHQLQDFMHYEPYLYEYYQERQAQQKWQNVLEFYEWLKRKGTSLDDDVQFDNKDLGSDKKDLTALVRTIQLMNLLDHRKTDNAQAIQLSTLHAAKGLEFDHVFLLGVEENILPYAHDDKVSPIEEERRLMYVGITRARESLHISWCGQRKQGGEMHSTTPSRFLTEMGLGPQTVSDDAFKAKENAYIENCLDYLRDFLKSKQAGKS